MASAPDKARYSCWLPATTSKPSTAPCCRAWSARSRSACPTSTHAPPSCACNWPASRWISPWTRYWAPWQPPPKAAPAATCSHWSPPPPAAPCNGPWPNTATRPRCSCSRKTCWTKRRPIRSKQACPAQSSAGHCRTPTDPATAPALPVNVARCATCYNPA